MNSCDRKRKKSKKKENKRRKSEFAAKLNLIRPKSEIWFEEKMLECDLRFPFETNCVFAGYIPDFINKHYKVIVEVDGSIHELERIKKRDAKKTRKYESLGYTVIRIKAYDSNSLEDALNMLKEIRLSKPCL